MVLCKWAQTKPWNYSTYLPTQSNTVLSLKVLYVEIDSCLSWKPHIRWFFSRLSRCLFLYSKHFHTFSKHLKQVYFSYFWIRYFLWYYFWGSSPDARKVVRLITKSAFNDLLRENFKNLFLIRTITNYFLLSIWNKKAFIAETIIQKLYR